MHISYIDNFGLKKLNGEEMYEEEIEVDEEKDL